MTSELQRVAQKLVEVFDQAPATIAALQREAVRQREHAALVIVDPSDSRLRDAASELDHAARKCEEAADKLALAAFHGRGWAQDMVDGVSPHNPPEDRPSWWPGPRPEGWAGPRPDGPDQPGESAPDTDAQPAVPKPAQSSTWKRHPLQDQIAVTGNPMDLIPDDATQKPFRTGQSDIEFGAKWEWSTSDGRDVELRVHGPDPTATAGSNAASGVVYRLRIKKRYISKDGTAHHPNSHKPTSPHHDPGAANATHIPWPDGVQYPSWENP